MNENQYFSYLDVGLPEAVEKMKFCGELEAAVDCIDHLIMAVLIIGILTTDLGKKIGTAPT